MTGSYLLLYLDTRYVSRSTSVDGGAIPRRLAIARCRLRQFACRAGRIGFTAETVIGALEDAEDYKAFEAAIIADYDAQSAVERELVLRLASALWRLRRATAMETGLFEIQAEHLSGHRQTRKLQSASREVVYALFRPADPGRHGDDAASTPTTNAKLLPQFEPQTAEPAADPSLHLACSY